MNSSKWKATTATKKKNNPAEGASGLKTVQRAGGGCASGSFLCTMSTPASRALQSRGTSDYYGQQYTTQSQTQARGSFLPSAKAGATKPAGPSLVARQGHQTEWLHPVGSIAAFLLAPSIFSTALQHGFYWQYFTDCSVDETVPCLMENSACIFLMWGFTTCIIWFPAKAIFDKNVTVS